MTKRICYKNTKVDTGNSDPLTLKSLISPISAGSSSLYEKLVTHRRRQKDFFDDSGNQENVNTINQKLQKRVSTNSSPRPWNLAIHENRYKTNPTADKDTVQTPATTQGADADPVQSIESTTPMKSVTPSLQTVPTPKKLKGLELPFKSPPAENSSMKAAQHLLMSAEKRRRELEVLSYTSGNILNNELLASAEKRNRELTEIAICCNKILNYKHPLP